MRSFSVRLLSIVAILTAGECCLRDASAATITLSPTADTSIIDVTPTTNYSAFNGGDYLSVYANGNLQRSLIQFDFSSIPAGATITGAVLTLYINPVAGSGPNFTNAPMEIYRATSTWIDAQATWNNRDSTNAWTTAGGDYVGTTNVANTNPYASNNNNFANTDGLPVTWTVTNLVNEWYTGANPNDGMVILSYLNNALVFHSSEATNSEFRPALEVTFTVPEPASMLLVVVSGALMLRRRRVAD